MLGFKVLINTPVLKYGTCFDSVTNYQNTQYLINHYRIYETKFRPIGKFAVKIRRFGSKSRKMLRREASCQMFENF